MQVPRIAATGFMVGLLAWPAAAGAQSAAAGKPVFLGVAPGFGASDPFDLSVPQPRTDPPATAPVAPPPPNYSFEDFARNVHGYVSAGIATQNGHELSGAVELPIGPGKAELELGAVNEQTGGFAPTRPGGKPGTASYEGYYASLHLHPVEGLDASIGISEGRSRFPWWPVPGTP